MLSVRGFTTAINQAIRLILPLVCAVSASAVTWVHRPYLQNVRDNRTTVVWSTLEKVGGVVQFSTDPTFSTVASVGAQIREFPASQTNWITFYQYRAELTGLAPGTVYSYRVVVNGENLTPEEDHRFRTMSPTEPFQFLVFGDSGSGSPSQQAMADVMAKERPNLVLHVGDIAYEEGTFEQFHNNYFNYYWPIMRRSPFFPAPGNHEYYTLNAQPYLDLHSLPSERVPEADRGRYYSFDWGNAHFVALDSNLLERGLAGKRMLEWLEQDLAATKAPWRIAYFHHVPYPLEHHVDDPLTTLAQQQIVPILEGHGVQLVLTGHEHTYLRTRPLRGGAPKASGSATVYVSTGGGGAVEHSATVRAAFAERVFKAAALYHFLRVEVDASQVTVRALDRNGTEFDRVVLVRPVLRSDAVVNSASFTSSLGAGGIVTIFGQGLAAATGHASTVPLPTAIAGTTVTVNGDPLPLLFASTTQINTQLRSDRPGPATLRVTTQSGTAETPIQVFESAPAIFSGGVRHADGSLVSADRPALIGETLVIYATGLGQVDLALPSGAAAPDSPLRRCIAPLIVQMGSVSVTPEFAGLTPRYVGLYQVNVKVPANLNGAVYPFRISAQGNFSNPVDVPVTLQ